MTEPEPIWRLGQAPTSRGFYDSGQRMRVGDLVAVRTALRDFLDTEVS